MCRIKAFDKNGGPLSNGDWVWFYSNGPGPPRRFLAKVVQVGPEKSILELEGGKFLDEKPVANKDLELL